MANCKAQEEKSTHKSRILQLLILQVLRTSCHVIVILKLITIKQVELLKQVELVPIERVGHQTESSFHESTGFLERRVWLAQSNLKAYTHQVSNTAYWALDHAMSTDKVMPLVQLGPPDRQHAYKVLANVASGTRRGAFIDRGANGGILGNDTRVILQHMQTVDVTGIDIHELNQLNI